MDDRKILHIIDGNSLLFRAYYATAYGGSETIMRNHEGIPTNAIFALANMLGKILRDFKGNDAIFVGFDADSDTFRRQEFEQYKANRKPAPPELIEQFPISRELLKCLSITCYEQHGVEADDICGSLAKLASRSGYQVEVYTSDKDYLQLIDGNITVNLLKTGLSNMERMDEKAMVERFGFRPIQIIDYKGLCGDSSDNLPGIPGVGEKTAVKLIKEYGSFEEIVKAAENMTSKVGQNIRENVELGRECYRLATIKVDLPLPFALSDLDYAGYDEEKVNAFAKKYDLTQFPKRLPASLKLGQKREEIDMNTVTSFKDVELGGKIGLSVDVDGDNYHESPLRGIAIASGRHAYYEAKEDMEKDETLKGILADPSIQKNVYDGKKCLIALDKVGIPLEGISFDILLAGYLLDSTVKNDANSLFASLGVELSEAGEVSLLDDGQAKSISEEAYYALHLEDKATRFMRSEGALPLYEDIEFPLMKVLAEMEREGFPIDGKVLEEVGSSFRERVASLEKEIYQMAGEEFNISSPVQVASLLYEKMGLNGGKKGSTSVDALKEYAKDYPIVAKILEYRKYSKLVGTYIDGLKVHILEDGKIHTCFNQAQTATGRLSSSNPNLQNISARDEEGKRIRQAFFYLDGEYSILSLDYSQIELRILAALSHCQKYIDVFNNGHDVHSETAKSIFHSDPVTPLERRRAKAVNFAIIYGTTPYGLAEQIDGTPFEAKRIIERFYLSYPEIRDYLNSIIAEAQENGYVKTMFGRKRYLRELFDGNYAKREAAKRQALNAPIQGSAADLIKVAMLHVDRFLKDGGYKTKMVLQIHDELIFKMPKDEEFLVPKLKELMVEAVSLPVKLEVEGSLGRTWYEAKD